VALPGDQQGARDLAPGITEPGIMSPIPQDTAFERPSVKDLFRQALFMGF